MPSINPSQTKGRLSVFDDTAVRANRRRRNAGIRPRRLQSASEAHVNVCSFNELRSLGYPLGLDSYQRPYVWDEVKLDQLVDDLLEFQAQPAVLGYYMGALLLHRSRAMQRLFVIDGQQRLASLSILYHVLRRRPPPRV